MILNTNLGGGRIPHKQEVFDESQYDSEDEGMLMEDDMNEEDPYGEENEMQDEYNNRRIGH